MVVFYRSHHHTFILTVLKIRFKHFNHLRCFICFGRSFRIALPGQSIRRHRRILYDRLAHSIHTVSNACSWRKCNRIRKHLF